MFNSWDTRLGVTSAQSTMLSLQLRSSNITTDTLLIRHNAQFGVQSFRDNTQ